MNLYHYQDVDTLDLLLRAHRNNPRRRNLTARCIRLAAYPVHRHPHLPRNLTRQ